MFDNRSYLHKLRSCEIKARKKKIYSDLHGIRTDLFFLRVYFHRLCA